MTLAADWERFWLEPGIGAQSMLAWRGVEAQHVVSTMRLVDSAAEQDLLEQLLEASKPALPATRQLRHYLLLTPFRYRPHHPSRFRPAHARGQWYGAEALYAACAEVAYWRRRFILDSTGLQDQTLLTEHSFFQAAIDGQAMDLMAPPWNQARALWTQGDDYAATQAVAAGAQQRGVQWLAYESARASGQRCAVVFDPDCLAETAGGLDHTLQTWHCKATRASVMFTRGRERHEWHF